VFALDPDGRILSFNGAGEILTGYTTDELVLLPYQRLLAPEDRARVEADFAQVSGGVATTSELNFVRRDNGRCRAKVTILPTIIDGVVVGAFWIAHDVTRRQETEELIREQAALLDNAQEAIYVQDLEGVIKFWNRSAERTYGHTAAEILGSSLQPHTARDLGAHEEAWRVLMEKGEWMGELAEVTASGKEITVEAHWTLVKDAGARPKSILCIHTDITERKKLEAQFLRAQRMESIGTLAGGIAHDLNNVLSPIVMAVELLKMKNDDPIMLDVLNTIETSARRGAEMVQQVLSFARGMEGERLIVQPKHLLREIQKIVADAFPKNIELKVAFQGDLWNVLGDPTQLHQVLLNLCVNARDAMPDGGRITLTAKNVTLDEQFASMNLDMHAGPHMVFEVQDNGTGMPPGLIEKIFDPFFTTKEPGKGTGLGLSTSLAIVKSHRGFIQVKSEIGQGSMFQIYLPAEVDEVAAENGAPQLLLPRGHGELIMVVDDEASIRTVTQQTLEAFGYKVVLACDGVDAVSVYAQRHLEIAAVITDMMMPIMDGPAMIQVLAKINPQGRIIAASGLAGQAQISKGTCATVKDFLPKPYTTEALLTTLARVLAN
jgi:PAS domain S-box-containing protein